MSENKPEPAAPVRPPQGNPSRDAAAAALEDNAPGPKPADDVAGGDGKVRRGEGS